MSRCSKTLSFIQFTPLHDTCPSPPPTPPSPPATSFCQSLAAFIEPLGAPLGGFLAEGFTTREEEEEILYSHDVEEIWMDVVDSSGEDIF